jgi:hypothetical protein
LSRHAQVVEKRLDAGCSRRRFDDDAVIVVADGGVGDKQKATGGANKVRIEDCEIFGFNTAPGRGISDERPAPLIVMPLVPDTSTDQNVPVASMVIDFVIVTAPKPPGSSTSISPPSFVFEIAPANVLHGAVRLPGFASSPTPDTHVREAIENSL